MTRPALTATLSGVELQRWYWLRAELASFARSLGVPAAGSKQALTERLVAHLDGRPPPPPAGRSSRDGLSGPLSEETLVPPGQRCTQALRGWFTDRLGPGFRFDGAMRAWFAAADGTTTLADAVAHWHATRSHPPGEIGAQFELNRFTRQWHLDHPGGDRAVLLADWARYRSLPVEERGRA